MGHLHQVIAVEQDHRKTTNKVLSETLGVFKRPTVFQGFVKIEKPVKEGEVTPPPEHKKCEYTVGQKLHFLMNHFNKYMDTTYQKEIGNQEAKADIVLPDGTVLGKDLPVSFLLTLETRFTELREVLANAPTLSVGVHYERVEDMGKGFWITKYPTVTERTEKITEPLVLYQATDKHPAQVDKIVKDVKVSEIRTEFISGMITSREKADMLERMDDLIIAVKKARHAANTIKISNAKVAKVFSDYILGDL